MSTNVDFQTILLHPESVDIIPRGDSPVLTRSNPRLLTKDKATGAEVEIDVNSMPDDYFDDSDNPFSEAMDNALDPYLKIPRNLKVAAEASLDYPANFWDMCVKHGKEVKRPFSRAVWLGYMTFGDCCPCTNIKARSNIFNIPVDLDPERLARSVNLFHHGVCPKCGMEKSKAVMEGKMPYANQLVLVAGQRGSKSATTAAFAAYQVALMVKAPKLSTIMEGLQSYAPLTGSLVGLTATKSFKLLYVPIRDLMHESEWFKKYFKVLKDHEASTGEELMRFTSTGTYMRIFHKNLELLPEPPNKRTLRGATRFLYAIDELGHFPLPPVGSDEEDSGVEDERERAHGEETYKSLDNSLLTLRTEARTLIRKGFNTVPTGLGFCLSSPASIRDMIMRLYDSTSGGKSPTTVAAKLATWEMSPLYTRDNPDLLEIERTNKVAFDRDFACIPPQTLASVVSAGTTSRLFGRTPNAFAINRVVLPNGRISGTVTEPYKAREYNPSIMVLDAGLVNNSFAMSVMHLDNDSKVIVTSVNEVMSHIQDTQTHGNGNSKNRGPSVEFDYPTIYANIIKPIIAGCNIKFLAADRWNSAYVLHQAEADFPDLIARPFKMKDDIVRSFLDIVTSENIQLPALARLPEGMAPFDYVKYLLDEVEDYRQLEGAPTDHLALQFVTVQSPKGEKYKLDKGHGYTDDIFRTLLLGGPLLYTKIVHEHLSQFRPISRNVGPHNVVAGFRPRMNPFGG